MRLFFYTLGISSLGRLGPTLAKNSLVCKVETGLSLEKNLLDRKSDVVPIFDSFHFRGHLMVGPYSHFLEDHTRLY